MGITKEEVNFLLKGLFDDHGGIFSLKKFSILECQLNEQQSLSKLHHIADDLIE